MDIISLYYFSELAKDLHMTRTANRLFISQQTLSNHIQRLEEYYGTQLLHRKPTLSLTSAGEALLDFANTVNQEHLNLKDLLCDIQNQQRGVLRFGASTMHMNAFLFNILPEFSARYPHVELRLTDGISTRLEPMVLEGHLDCAVAVMEGVNPNLVIHPLIDDQMYLCVADSLLRRYYGEEAEALKERAISGAHVADFARLPFCMFENRTGQQIQQCFDEAGIRPNTFITSTYTQLSIPVCAQRLAAGFIPHANLVSRLDELPEDINIFPLLLRGQPFVQSLSLIHHKERYLSHYFEFFLQQLIDYFGAVKTVQIARRV